MFHVPARKVAVQRIAEMARVLVKSEPTPLELLIRSSELKSVLKAALPFSVADAEASRARLPVAFVEN